MKKLTFALLFLALFFGVGCSYKAQTLTLGEPKSVYIGAPLQSSINLISVSDARADKSYVLQVKEGDKHLFINSKENLEEWLKESFKKELAAAAGEDSSPKSGAVNMSVTLKTLEISYDKSSLTGKNLKLFAQLSVMLENEKGRVIKAYKFDEQKWIKPAFGNEPLQKETTMFLSSAVASIVKELAAGVRVP